MRQIFITIFIFYGILLAFGPPISNGQDRLAQIQFKAAKACFQDQRYFLAERWAQLAAANDPSSAAARILIGQCFYRQDQDAAALFYFSKALALDPTIGHLPPFLAELRKSIQREPRTILKGVQLWELRKKIGQMIMVSVPGTRITGQKKDLLKAGWIGGVILFDQNIKTKEQIRDYISRLQQDAPTPLFIAVDQEGGAVRRLREAQGFLRLPSQAALGQTHNPKLAYRFGLLSGHQLREIGANLNLAPVVDLNQGSPDSIITKYRRSLGSDPRMVADLAEQIVMGMKAEDVIATAKHFPSETVSASNPHHQMATANVSLKELETRDMAPYRFLIDRHSLDAIMLSHVIYKNVDPYFPASLSYVMIQTVLRQGLGYQGLVISDDLRMDA
ncbi:MAG: beta-N-acetylhexosaminidase, partial [bacterium]